MKRAHPRQIFVAFRGHDSPMSKNRKTRIPIGLHMPGWLPRQLHLPARLVLGLALGGCLAAYAVALATVVHRLLDLSGDPVVQLINLSLLIIGAIALRGALVLWSRGLGRAPERREI
jgi:hypothetical protein